MPIKLPKGFQRRKSSGNALEEAHHPPDSSFRVLERPASKGKSFDGGASLRMGTPGPPRPPPQNHFEHEEEDIFAPGRHDASNRGSGGTERSHSTAPNDSAASSTRLSTSSTNPSSIDTRSDKIVHGSGSRPYNDIPVPLPASARPGFLRNPTRTCSFGVTGDDRRSPTSFSPAGIPPLVDNGRNRATTTSTTSTATPPRLFDSDLALENPELDGFGNMFDHIGSSPDTAPVRLIQQEDTVSSPTSYPPTSYPAAIPIRSGRAPAPKPITTDRTQVVETSPYSWTSHDSREGLMRSPSPSKTITEVSPAKANENTAPNISQNPMPRSKLPSRKPVGQRSLTQKEDVQPPPLQQTRSTDSNLLSTSPAREMERGTSPNSTHSATLDPTIAADAQLAHMYEESKPAPPKPAPSNKVMTPAQWERYKQEKEMDRRLGALSDDSSSEAGDNYEDEDEVERDRQVAKQRRKQEAHLAVYRQKMMKVTGETPPPRAESSLNVMRSREGSSGDLNNRLSHLTVESKQSGKSSGDDEDEDEDVPLGILAAHGFPNKNRPPTRLAHSPSNSNLRSVGQAQPAPSAASQAPKEGNLPVFARHLPQDPYYGASLVNPSNRESLAFHPVSPSLGAGPSTAHPVHPAGLVGVIAGEERARAARRGSPNPSGGYDMPGLPQHPGMARSQTTGSLPVMGYPPMGMSGMPPMMSPGDQAQIRMSQQMTQMMQVQMQWMQQMQQMMGRQFNPNPDIAPPQFGQQNFPDQGPRPPSIPNASGPQPGQRTMSTLNPSMAPWNSNPSVVPSINVNGNYAPSIAPSERSNIGLASRYRPVSTAPEPDNISPRRASTFTSSSFRPWSQTDNTPRVPMHAMKPSVNTIGRRSPLANQDDEDDEQGWAEMKLKKDKKQKTWALRKGQNALQELYTNAA
ncbi:uncharacterized protein Z518_10540 [Rhinocladiella mackenziei CBS 650.93]|uniref:Uncharacterized protein n=1 Tax=Rhinocladiella mackenziei CBS 650.93 TaxID=1442369 RepID=A0A0D2IAU8_9EURO|nr:uncharacterized protein Z518_10540 [Rhinocladiella mackenziei CBS 650.93]KIX00401.1 hypothetical protein Z518_10540 [Rhinocladiella mackenziei CBS 650.93]